MFMLALRYSVRESKYNNPVKNCLDLRPQEREAVIEKTGMRRAKVT